MPLIPLAPKGPVTPSVRQTKTDDKPPPVYVLSGPAVVTHCSGQYFLTDEVVNGHRMWVHVGGKMFLYSDTNKGWSVCNNRSCFVSGNSIISSENKHHGLLPHQMRVWCYGDGKNWIPCKDIVVMTEEEEAERMKASRSCMTPLTTSSTSPNASFFPKCSSTSHLTTKELKWLKDAFDTEVAKVRDMATLKNVLLALGITTTADINAIDDFLQQARELVDDPPTAGRLLTLPEFMMLCDVLKAHHIKAADQLNNDTLEAFVAMGGNIDQSGEVRLEHLKKTAKDFDLSLDSGVLDDSGGRMGYNEFNTLLQPTIDLARDTFLLAGGDASEGSSTVPVLQLRRALETLFEIGSITYAPAALECIVERVGERAKLTLHDFTKNMWIPLGLPNEYVVVRQQSQTALPCVW